MLKHSFCSFQIWSHWGNDKKEVRLCLRRIDNEVDSGRGSPVGRHTPSLRRKRNRIRGYEKPLWTHQEGLHPRRLAELGKFSKTEYNEYNGRTRPINNIDELAPGNHVYNNNINNHCNYEEIYNNNESNNENIIGRKKSGQKSYQCSGTGRLHSTLLSEYDDSKSYSKRSNKCCSKRESKHKGRNSENIEKLMKLILAQGATIQNQLQKLKEREEQIESLEQERHRERIEKNGRNYLLETYLGSLKDAEIPNDVEEERDDSGVLTEGGSDQMNAIKKENIEGLKQNETEPESDTNDKLFRTEHRRQSNRSADFNYSHPRQSSLRFHPKKTRSRSESRNQESKLEINLKRTLSDNSIAEGTAERKPDAESYKNLNNYLNTKDESDEIVELQKIQSQIDMWEKVFKINKKLEKEEETLVRLHIKIKKCQSENYRIAKDKDQLDEKENPEITSNHNEETKMETAHMEGTELEQSCTEIEKSLEVLKSNLDQNSKEIYQNFTRLIEEDEKVEQKRHCLSKLISDLERTKQEEDMLNEMISLRTQQSLSKEQFFSENLESSNTPIGNRCPESNNIYTLDHYMDTSIPGNYYSVPNIPANTDNNSMCSKFHYVPQPNNSNNQRIESKEGEQEELQTLKPKIVKISFEDQIQNNDSSEISQEKSTKEPVPVAVGALKSILKNRKNNYNRKLENSTLSNVYQPENNSTLSNHENNNFYNQNYTTATHSFSQRNVFLNRNNSDYSYSPQGASYYHPVQELNQSYFPLPPKCPENFNTCHLLKSPQPLPDISQTHTNIHSHSTMVKTKASVHNDTDSSTSSDTSGLCSMYSSSPTAEEHYVDRGYILDTLV